MLNFFRVDISATILHSARTKTPLTLVDMPGYGYAKVPIAIKEKWNRTVFQYLRSRREYE
jgi:GTP-binding protein EngB required for normal cell division